MNAKILPLHQASSRLEKVSQELEAKTKSDHTHDAYSRAVKAYQAYCTSWRHEIGPDSFRWYLITMNLPKSDGGLGRALSTIRQHYSGIIAWDKSLKHWRVEQLMEGITREHAFDAPNHTNALTLDMAQRILSTIPTDTSRGIRDRALITTCWVTASRKKELLGIDVDHIVSADSGYTIRVLEKGSDTARDKYINRDFILDAHQNLEHWLNLVESWGPLWRPISRSGNVINRRLSRSGFDSIFKGLLGPAEIDPKLYSPHSIRGGFVTHGASNNMSLAKIQAVTGHKSVESLKHYWDRAELLKNHPMSGDNQ